VSGEWVFDVEGAFRMRYITFTSLIFALFLMKPDPAHAKEINAVPIFYCTTKHTGTDGQFVNQDFFIKFNDVNVVVKKDMIFFGGSKFFFLDGYIANSMFSVSNRKKKFVNYDRDDFERRSHIDVKEGGYTLSISNLDSDKLNATFNIRIKPTGLVFSRIEDWGGECRQLGSEDNELLAVLQSLEKVAQ
jgi:hypothetical protein